jgi:hypothetical protein
MPATVICFESFCSERNLQRAHSRDRASAIAAGRAAVALTARQIAHRRAILDYWSQRDRLRFTAAATEPE